MVQQDVRSALVAAQQALNLAQESSLDELACKAYNQLGSIYTDLGFHTNALEEFHRGLELSKQNNWPAMQAEILTNIGNVYFYEDSLSRALHYYEESMLVSQKIADVRIMARNLCNIGLVNSTLGQYAVAEPYLRQSLMLSRQIKHSIGICMNLKSMGDLYHKQNQQDSAQHYYQLALQMAKESSFVRGKIFVLISMANRWQKLNQLAEAEKLLLEALVLSKQTSSISTIKEVLLGLSEQKSLQGNYRQALDYQRQYSSLSDSINILAQRTEQKHFYHLLEAERNISENRLLKANVAARENELKASMANHQKHFAVIIASCVALTLVIGLMLFLLYHYRQGQKNHQQLQHMHAAIQAQAHELEDAYKKIQQHNLALESSIEERTRQLNQQNSQLIQYAYFNAHKVRGPLARILGLVNLLPKSEHQAEFKFIMERLDESAKELDKVVHEINLILEVKQTINHDN